MRAFARAAVALLLAFGLAGTALAAPPVWRVTSPTGGEVVLFGSVHLLKKGLDWRTPELDRALAAADEVWFEIPIGPSSQVEGAAAAAELGLMPAGERLTDLLPAEDAERLARVAAKLGLPMVQLDSYKPWFAEVVLSLTDLSRQGALQALGVEDQLAARVPEDAQLKAFETAREQVEMLATQSEADQLAALRETLEQMETDPTAFAELQTAWMAGDVDWIEREALAPMRKEVPRLYERLVAARNRSWAGQIDGLLKAADHAFIVVGVGHLVGEDGLPAMLRRRGFVVEGP